ncbi:MAG TPA: hypothetical protein VKA84_22465 [Gemmatimonadaceae bacterium]|nr:hypothetical protein [Gemmatimonadaceae bacterium]
MNEKQLAKLIKKTTAKAEKNSSKVRPAKAYDQTLQNRPDHDEKAEERGQFFDEMKRREF